jgi:hypothetical protein
MFTSSTQSQHSILKYIWTVILLVSLSSSTPSCCPLVHSKREDTQKNQSHSPMLQIYFMERHVAVQTSSLLFPVRDNLASILGP